MSGDRDLLALVKDPHVRLLVPREGRQGDGGLRRGGRRREVRHPSESVSGLRHVARRRIGRSPRRAGDRAGARRRRCSSSTARSTGSTSGSTSFRSSNASCSSSTKEYLDAMKTVVGLVDERRCRADPASEPDPVAGTRSSADATTSGASERLLLSLACPSSDRGARVTRVFLVRHGATDWNVNKRAQGQADVPLNEKGQLQALDVRGASVELRSKAVYSSDLSRA